MRHQRSRLSLLQPVTGGPRTLSPDGAVSEVRNKSRHQLVRRLVKLGQREGTDWLDRDLICSPPPAVVGAPGPLLLYRCWYRWDPPYLSALLMTSHSPSDLIVHKYVICSAVAMKYAYEQQPLLCSFQVINGAVACLLLRKKHPSKSTDHLTRSLSGLEGGRGRGGGVRGGK